MLNSVNEKRLPKTHNIKIKNYPGTTSEDILYKLDHLLKNKSNC